jgi:hypothetical protein
MAAEEQSKMIGAHQLLLEPDVILIRQHGDYHLSDAHQVADEINAIQRRYGQMFMIIDQTQAGTTPPESRRFLAEWNKQNALRGVAIFGGSPTVRALATLITTAIRLFRSDSSPLVFTANEAEARAWIDAQRTK